MSDLRIVKCPGCGQPRWWVSAEASPPLCFDCSRKAPESVTGEVKDERIARVGGAEDGCGGAAIR